MSLDDELDSENIDFAVSGREGAFDAALPKRPTRVLLNQKRITYLNESGNQRSFGLEHEDNSTHQMLFRALSSYFQLEQTVSDTSLPGYYNKAHGFVDWLNSLSESDDSRDVRILNHYQTYLLNERNLKPKVRAVTLVTILRGALTSGLLNREEERFIDQMIRNTRIMDNEPASVTLSDWFNLPWLREEIGDLAYLQLESAKRLLLSFRITVAETLSFLLEAREARLKHPPVEVSSKPSPYEMTVTVYAQQMTNTMANLQDGRPADPLSEVLLTDVLSPYGWKALEDLGGVNGKVDLSASKRFNGRSRRLFRTTVLLRPEFREKPSDLEQKLAAWLVACEAVQPTDIVKLKRSDYAVELKPSGGLLMMQNRYYKGRSGGYHEPEVLSGNLPWTKAFYGYLTAFRDKNLFEKSAAKQLNFPNLKQEAFAVNSSFSLFFNLIQGPLLSQRIQKAHQSNKAQPLFVSALLALSKGSVSYVKYRNEIIVKGGTWATPEDYRNAVPRPLPIDVFSLTHIKNTAVHARSDRYREDDFYNVNSHTSLTEKTDYLTDDNKDFVNRAGRITRLVINDMANHVYMPSLERLNARVQEKELRTKVIEATENQNAKVHSFGSFQAQEDDSQQILVNDTVETALFMINYLEKAKEVFHNLIAVRPDWVEETLLVELEWFERTLEKMQSHSSARKQYAELADVLPNPFSHLLETHL